MRGQLADSLGYLARSMTAQLGESHPELDRLVATLQAGAIYPPSTFGLYYELAAALMDGDEAAAASLLDELSRERAMAASGVDVLQLDQIFPEASRARYQRLMDTDPDTPFRIISLFGLTIDEPLVLNDDRELFASPLRDDPRPMDGIYHATYVSARMHWAMAELLKCGKLGEEKAAQATDHLDANRRNFWSDYATVMPHARLSETGRLLLASAHAKVRSTYSPELIAATQQSRWPVCSA